MFSQVINGVAQPPALLPKNYGNVSNFDALPDSELNGYGFYRFESTGGPPEYNPLLVKPAVSYVLNGLIVNDSYTLEPLSDEEKARLAQEMKAKYSAITRKYCDDTVAVREYETALTAVSWEGDVKPEWNAEGVAVKTWRSQVWQTAYAIQSEVIAGLRPLPSESEYIQLLPVLEWPS